MTESITQFDATKEALIDLLKDIKNGRMQLPDFQRGWIWDNKNIISLIASIALSYPIGTIMLLQTGNDNVKFKIRPIEGIENPINEAERLILDGQQRLTSLYQAIFSEQSVKTRNSKDKEISRFFYFDIKKSLNNVYDLEESIISVHEDKKIKNFRGIVEKDLSSVEKECIEDMFPLNITLDIEKSNKWQTKYLQTKPDEMEKRLKIWNDFSTTILSKIQQYQIPLILLRKQTPKEAVCQVFEKVNTGGVTLTVFELLTASFAAENFNLRDIWEQIERKFKKHKLLNVVGRVDFLQVISLLSTYSKRLNAMKNGTSFERLPSVMCKRNDILKLTLNEFEKWYEKAQEGFIKASKLLFSEKLFDKNNLPHRTQLVPLAAVMELLGDNINKNRVRNKLLQWYWCGIFGELYSSTIEARLANDVIDIIEWVENGKEPRTIEEANFRPERLLSLRNRKSAAYKGIYILLLKNGIVDFRSGTAIKDDYYFEENIDIHHIFPKKWCDSNKIEPEMYNCIINKTPLSYKTNRKIGGKAPSKYLEILINENDISDSDMKNILESHFINYDYLKIDDFRNHFLLRAKLLVDIISRAMNKNIDFDNNETFKNLSGI